MASFSPCWKYDVFLSFRGKETRNTFTAHLYHALCSKGINAFIDDRLERGEHITSQLNQVIEESRISLIIFSQNYARSIYCLDELVKILECKESEGQVVFPVFYNVDPSDVEEQNGSFGEALRFHETYWGVNIERVQKWREALTKAAQLSGWHLDNGNEAKFIWRIVEKVLTQLNHTSLHVAAYQVGLDHHIEEMNHVLNTSSNDVCMVGICGIGGIGKTTIAKTVYNLIANQFEGGCFLSNVRDISKQYGLLRLQETLLYEILGDKNLVLGSVDRGINVIKNRFCNKKVLIVIDDVDNLDQLKQLTGEREWFGLGSRIIITTRDEHLLVVHGVERLYKVKELCPDDALVLFSGNAFRNPHPPEHLLEISLRVVRYAQGLPLALVVLGSFLYGRSIREWESELDKLKRIPNKQVYEVLKISFDGLEYNEKAIFLDIACFFKGQEKDYVIKILDACDFNPDIGIQVLMEKSLIYIENNKLQMHDLLQSMGRQIVHEESPNIPGRRSRLWFHEDVLQVLTENMGSYEIEGILLDTSKAEKLYLSPDAFTKMKRLRILIVHNLRVIGVPENLPNELRWLEWPECPIESLPSTFHARKLVVFNMQRSSIRHLGEGFKVYSYLKHMDFRDCEFLTETPDFSTIPNLERLNLEGCTSLVKIHQSIGFLDKLVFLSLEFCSNLRSLSGSLRSRSLQTLLLTGCSKLEKFPNIEDRMTSIERVCLNGTAIKELPSSIENLVGLKVLTLSFCRNLSSIPCSIYMLPHLKCLLLEGCSKLKNFPEKVGNERLSIFSMVSLKLNDGPMWFPKLTCLDLRNCNLLEVDFLRSPDCFSMLKDLDLSGNNFVSLPTSICRFTNLRCLKLVNCKWLQEIPELPQRIKRIAARDCKSLERYSQLTRVFKISEEERSKRLHDLDFSNCHKLAENPIRSLTSIALANTFLDKTGDVLDANSNGFCENFRIEVFLPGSEIPRWFSHHNNGGYLSFLVCPREIKAVVLCTILSSEGDAAVNISREVFINGQTVISFSRQFFSLESDHMWLYYLPCRMIWDHNSSQNDWSRFEVLFNILGEPTSATIRRCGIHLVYNQDANVSFPSSCNGSVNFSETCSSLSLDLMRSCSDGREFAGYQQPLLQWQHSPFHLHSSEIPPMTISSPMAQLVHQGSSNGLNSFWSRKRPLEQCEDHNSSSPDNKHKTFRFIKFF